MSQRNLPVVSICVPCYNEGENVVLAHDAVVEVFESLTDRYDYEIVYADNCSTESTKTILRNTAANDSHVKVIFNAANYGPGRSGANCLLRATGDVVVLLPCDLQDPPALIPEMLEKLDEGYDIALGKKVESDESKIMYSVRSMYYSTLKRLSDLPIHEQCDGFGAYSRRAIDAMRPLLNGQWGVKALASKIGFNVAYVNYRQAIRRNGKSSYSLFKYCDLGLSTVVQCSNKVPTMMLLASLVCEGATCLVLLLYLILCICGISPFSGLVVLMLILAALLSMNGMFISVVAKYASNIEYDMLRVPLVIEQDTIGFR